MACACKRSRTLEDDFGVREDEGLVTRLLRYIMKVVMFVILVVISLVMIPILFFVVIYKASFTRDMTIRLPDFLGKHLSNKPITADGKVL